MKKLTYLSLMGLMGILVSCGGNNADGTTEPAPADGDTTVVEEVIETPVETTDEATTEAAE